MCEQHNLTGLQKMERAINNVGHMDKELSHFKSGQEIPSVRITDAKIGQLGDLIVDVHGPHV